MQIEFVEEEVQIAMKHNVSKLLQELCGLKRVSVIDRQDSIEENK
jgi:hypothetical protein